MKVTSRNIRRAAEKLAAKLGISVAAATLMVTEAMAALPTEATAAFTTLSSNVTDIFAAIWPIVAVTTGGWVLIKLFKKGANKTT